MRLSTLIVSLVFAALACGQKEADPEPPRIPVTVRTASGPVTFRAELADTQAERARGLMHRRELGEREGMLFLFPAEQQLSFWMKNTLIPLDMLFIRADHTILGVVREAEPKTLTPRRVTGQSQYVLEIRGGLAEELGIEAGQEVRFMAPGATD